MPNRIDGPNASINVPPPLLQPADTVTEVPNEVRDDFVVLEDGFDSEVAALKRLPSFMGKSGNQTFYISKPRHSEFGQNGEVACAYWKEDHSIIVFNLPYSYGGTDDDLWWLSYKGRIDLTKDVVPHELLNMGCCLVTRSWADTVLRWCKRGYKLRVSSKDSQSAVNARAKREIEVYGTWWTPEQLETGFDADAPPVKSWYQRIQTWDASTETSPHPDRLDIVYTVSNDTDETVRIRLNASVDFKISSSAIVLSQKDEESAERVMQGRDWQNQLPVGDALTVSLKPGESRTVKFANFELMKFLRKFFDPKNDLWPYKMRARVIETNITDNAVCYTEKAIDLLPAD